MNELWKWIVEHLLKEGRPLDSRNGGSLELIGMAISMGKLDAPFLTNGVRKMSPIYAMAELIWYMSGRCEIDMIKAYAKQYVNFANHGIAYGAYGHRMRYLATGQHQLHEVVKLLRRSPNTRQAIISLWDRKDLLSAEGTIRDLPCTLSWQFLLREGELHMVTTMRSEDVWLGLPYDVFVNRMIQLMVANELGVKAGGYMHNVGSLHIYEKDIDKCKRALDDDAKDVSLNWKPWDMRLYDCQRMVVESEENLRTGKGRRHWPEGILGDAYWTVATKWYDYFHLFECREWQEIVYAYNRRLRSDRKDNRSESTGQAAE